MARQLPMGRAPARLACIPAQIAGEVPVVTTAQAATTAALHFYAPGIGGFQVPRPTAVTGWFAYVLKLGPAKFADPEGCRDQTRVTTMAGSICARPEPEVYQPR